jgi:hypothetical protein
VLALKQVNRSSGINRDINIGVTLLRPNLAIGGNVLEAPSEKVGQRSHENVRQIIKPYAICHLDVSQYARGCNQGRKVDRLRRGLDLATRYTGCGYADIRAILKVIVPKVAHAGADQIHKFFCLSWHGTERGQQFRCLGILRDRTSELTKVT